MAQLPKVMLVGRTNVGKSTLFNRLSENVKSITLDAHGVTRDFLTDVVCWKDYCFELVDSGGISLQKSQDILAEKVRLLGLSLLQEADLIIFVVDGKSGFLPEDRGLAKHIHTLKKPAIVVVNKIDNLSAQEFLHEFYQTGFDTIIGISAQHGLGIPDLLEAVEEKLPAKKAGKSQQKAAFKVVLLGKPNVGKSSLMNLLLNKERSLVADIPGTTREAISEPIHFYQETIQVTDTPGIRKKSAVKEDLEEMMVKSSLRAMHHADIVLLIVDGSQETLSDQELKLAFYAFKEGKALLLVVNKSDLLDDAAKEKFLERLKEYQFFVKKLSVLFISCITQKNVGKILPTVQTLWQRYSQRISDYDLTVLLKNALQEKPLYHKTEMLILFKAQQIKTAPMTILLFVNQPAWFGDSQLAFFENILRAQYDLVGVPVLFVVRKKFA